jgi:hypothetical protein
MKISKAEALTVGEAQDLMDSLLGPETGSGEDEMPSKEWLSGIVSFAAEDADERQHKILYPFDLNDVDCIYTLAFFNDGTGGDGIWFRLKNGTIYDIMGNRLSRRKGSFEQPVKGFAAIRIAEYVMSRLHGREPTDFTQ